MANEEFINESKYEFSDISSEKYREYRFVGGERVRLTKPVKLSVSENGHRVWTADGISHYIPKGWIHLEWLAEDGKPHFVK